MKKHSKQSPDVTKQHKLENAPKKDNITYRRRLHKARQIAYLIHEDLHLTFGQCVQLVLTNYQYGYVLANKNIRKHNADNMNDKDAVVISEFDEGTFNTLLNKKLAFAAIAASFTV